MKFLVRSTFVALLFAACVWSQTTSQITGTVHDPSGAAVPGATVKATQTDTGFTRTTVTTNTGDYLLPTLPIGPYKLEVTKTGFSTYVEAGIVIEVNTNPTINPTLKVGAVSDTVTVEAEALTVETHSTGIGQVVDHDEVADLPLNARDPTQMMLLVGNATTQGANASDENSNKNFPTITVSIAGGNGDTINFSLDGAPANEVFNNLNQPLPFPDALQEFKVETSAVGASSGGHASAQVTVATRSGTNSLHGNAFEYLRNYDLNSRGTATARDSLKQNQFGGTVGGALIKNKLFYFVGNQTTIKKSNPPSSTGDSMTPAMLTGNFQTIASSTCQKTPIVLAAPFVNNIVPLSAMNPIALNMFKYFPNPAGDAQGASAQENGCGLFSYETGSNQNQYQTPVKVDYTISPKQSAFVRYQYSKNYTPTFFDPADPLFTGSTTGQSNTIQATVLGDSYTISPTFVSSTHVQADRSYNPRFTVPFVSPSDLGVPITSFVPASLNMAVTGGFNIGQNPGYFNTLTYSGAEDFTLIKGKHQFTFGGQYMLAYMHAQNVRGVNGNISFTGQYTNTAAAGGLGYSDFVMGDMNGFGQGRPFYDDDRSNYYGLYIQDAWRVGAHLTLNLGLRDEPYLPQTNTDDYVATFNLYDFAHNITGVPPASNPALTNVPPGMLFPGDPGMPPNQQYQFRLNHLLPRVGIVWDPTGKGKTSIRASYGLLHDYPHMFFYTRVSNNPPWGATITEPSGEYSLSNPWATYAGGNPFAATSTSGKSFGFFPAAGGGVYVTSDVHVPNPQVNTWNIALQRQVGKWLLSVSYQGNHTAHLWDAYNMDSQQFIPGNCVAGQYGLTAAGPCDEVGWNNSGNKTNSTQRGMLYVGLNVPGGTALQPILNTGLPLVTANIANPAAAPLYGSEAATRADANDGYNSMTTSAQHRLGQNFSILANWTWSHCLGEPSQTETAGTTVTLYSDRGYDYGPCTTDHRENVNISGTVLSPKMNNHLANLIVYGWQFAPIFHWGTGALATASYAVDVSGQGLERAQQILPSVYTNSGIPTNYLNINAFLTDTAAEALPFGTVAGTTSGTISNPDEWNLDAALSRNFRIRERYTLTFRFEAFNVSNSVIMGGVSTGVNSANFGALSPVGQSTAPGGSGTGRIMQAALKIAF